MFGYKRNAPEPPVIPPVKGGDPSPQKPPLEGKPLPPEPTPFWRLVGHLSILGADEGDGVSATPSGGQAVAYPSWHQRPTEPAPFQPLAPWRDLNVRLRHALGFVESGHSIDIDRVVERIGRGEFLDRLPRTALSRWCGRVQVMADRSRRLIPYFDDQRDVVAHIHPLVAAHDFWVATLADGAAVPISYDRAGYAVDYQLPPPGTPVLVLGDLGCLAGGVPDVTEELTGLRRFWLAFGQRLRAAGCRPVVLFPGRVDRCPPELAKVWTLTPWVSRHRCRAKHRHTIPK
ncbi:MAG: hypothetical protein HQL07_05705, partial [Nitrospirae bacterium]|nr:hypothetical protein [Magnetococcales bacterium]